MTSVDVNYSFKKGQLCIIHSDNEWDKLYGIIDRIDYESKTLYIFTVQIPYFVYETTFDNASKILEIVKE